MIYELLTIPSAAKSRGGSGREGMVPSSGLAYMGFRGIAQRTCSPSRWRVCSRHVTEWTRPDTSTRLATRRTAWHPDPISWPWPDPVPRPRLGVIADVKVGNHDVTKIRFYEQHVEKNQLVRGLSYLCSRQTSSVTIFHEWRNYMTSPRHRWRHDKRQ